MNKDVELRRFPHPEEKLEFAKILDCVNVCAYKHEPVFSGFLDAYKAAAFVRAVCCIDGISVNALAYGGYPDAERKMIGIVPEWMEADFKDFPISVIELGFGRVRSKIPAHRDVLGAVLSLGIDRKNVGDIVVSCDKARVLVHSKLAEFVASNVTKVANIGVKAALIPPDEVFFPVPVRVESTIVVPSMRLDAVISASFNISRGEAVALISAGKAFVNWRVSTPAAKVAENDVITLRGAGRVEILGTSGTTKKDNIALRVYAY